MVGAWFREVSRDGMAAQLRMPNARSQGVGVQDSIVFATAAAALLAVPGPTNTLLAAAGAASGFVPSLTLAPAKVLGHGLAITVLSVVIGPLQGMINVALHIVCCCYLVHAAFDLWRQNSTEPRAEPRCVSFLDVFNVTVLNPKNLVFAFSIVPLAGQNEGLSPFVLVALAIIMTISAILWIGLGAALRHQFSDRMSNVAISKFSALVLLMFSVMIFATALSHYHNA